jgi:Fe-S-cluster containining protein
VVTDLVEIRRISEVEREENLDFRRYLKAHHCPEESFHILASEVESQIDCTQCANCCRELVVSVSAEEVQAIADWLHITEEDVLRLYTEPDPDGRKKRTLRSHEGGCVFLDKNLCMIYEVRPKCCRDFPHSALRERTLGGRMSSQFRRMSVCPIVFNAIEAYKHNVGFHARAHHE